MRMSAAKSSLMRFISWTQSEASDDRERRNKESTFSELGEMINLMYSGIENLKSVQAMIYPDRLDHEVQEIKPATTDSSQSITLTADSLVAAFAAFQAAQAAQAANGGALTVPAITAVSDNGERKQSDAEQSAKSESTDIIPKLSADVKTKKAEQAEKTEKKDQKGWVNWKELVEQYSVAINNLNDETFELDEARVCAEYLKRWMDALKIGFKRKDGKIKFGADKIADAIPKFILVITQSIIDGKFDDFKEDFQRWELRARGEDKSATLEMMSHGLPYMVYHAYDDIKRYAANDYANAVYRDFLDGSLRSVSRMRNGKERCEYLSTSAISALIDSVA